MDEDRREILRSYPNIWNYRKKIYNIDTIKLWIPLALEDACFIALGVAVVFMLCKIFPFLNGIPFVFRWFVIPFLIMKFMTKKKFDGKRPHKFLIGYLSYLLRPKRYERFRPFYILKGEISYTPIAFRLTQTIDITDLAVTNLKKNRKERKKRKNGKV